MDIYREILQYLHYHPLSSRDEIARGTAFEGSTIGIGAIVIYPGFFRWKQAYSSYHLQCYLDS